MGKRYDHKKISRGRLIMLLFFGVLFSVELSAQRFRAGILFGSVATDVQGADARNDFHKLGFTAGGLANLQLTDKNTFQFEINYITKGSLQGPDSSNQGYYKLILNYVEVPFVFRHRMEFAMNKKQRTHFEVELGASVGRVINFRTVANNYTQTFEAEDVNFTDISIFAGVNYVFNEHFYLGFRYANSLIPALKRNSINPVFLRYTFNNGNNMVGQLTLHYVFGKSNPIPTESSPQEEAPPAD